MTDRKGGRPVVLVAAVLVGMCATGGAIAQESRDPAASIDALIDASTTPEGAIAAARAQAADGDLLGAAATLERVLSATPGLRADDLRLYYATVLCRLDDRRRAAYQFANVVHAGAAGWAEAREACGDIAQAGEGSGRRDSMLSGVASIGVARDGDAFSAIYPLLTGVAVPGAGSGGTSLVAGLDVLGRKRLGERGFFYGGLSMFAKDSVSGPRLEYQGAAAKAGFGARLADAVELAAGAVVRHVRVQGDPFVREQGGQASLQLTSGASRWSLEGESVMQHYQGPAFNAARNGHRYDLAATYRHASDGGAHMMFGMAYEAKNALQRDLGYRGGRVFAAGQWPIAQNGAYLNLSGTLRRLDYRNVAFVSDLIERRLFARAAVGFPLADRLALEPAVTYTRRDYNAASGYADYHSVGAELRLVYRFGEK